MSFKIRIRHQKKSLNAAIEPRIPGEIPNELWKILQSTQVPRTDNKFSFLFQLSLFHSYSSACRLTMFIPWILIQRVKKYIQSLLHITKSWKFHFYWILDVFQIFFSFFLRFISKKVYFPAFSSLLSVFWGEEFNRCPKKFMRSFKKNRLIPFLRIYFPL